uniref:Suppressor of forked domain-containing protein n=1 Tax=Plectus sambesii TaxID=2011161 RepID=A0A914W2K5_9BILA
MSRDRDRSRSRSADRDVLEICWKPVKEDPTNFDAWTHLLQCVEQMDETRPAREAYDEFLKKYPYCYGYWRKYAELERRHKHYERCIDVYERGVTAISLSIDVWLSYLAFLKEYSRDKDGKEHKIRHLYERAISAAGLEFRSDKLWEDYINWELKQKNLPMVTALYDRLLKAPTQLYSQHFERFQEFVNSNAPDKILSEEEYDQIYKFVESELKDKNVEIYVVEEVREEAQENGDETPKTNNDLPAEGKTEYRKKYADEALKLFRVEILEKRRKLHLYNEQEVSKRWPFEEGIKRPYFHVKPLERAQLKNWRAYLDFEIGVGIHERVIVLFERCLIACAMYEDMWLRYARYLEGRNDVDIARAVYKRATTVHLPKKPGPHLAFAAFEEKNGNLVIIVIDRHGDNCSRVIDKSPYLIHSSLIDDEKQLLCFVLSFGKFDEAKSLLTDFDRKNPGYIMIQLRRIGVERRQATHDARIRSTDDQEVAPDFAQVTATYEKHIRDPRTPTKMASFYALKFARFHAKVRGDKKLAEKIIKDALSRDKDNPQLYLQLIDLAFSATPFSEQAVVDAFDRGLHSQELPDYEKVRLSQRKLEFLEDLGTDIVALQEHFEYHTKLYKSVGGGSSG